LAAVRVQDFKTLRDVLVPLNNTTTALVGENNSGKISFLEALDDAFGKRVARVQDLYSGAGGRATTFHVDLRIEPADETEFHEKVVDIVG
jgi:predicted ATP-dependent endonuclease of OLD family